jgi:hypothetical protein
VPLADFIPADEQASSTCFTPETPYSERASFIFAGHEAPAAKLRALLI